MKEEKEYKSFWSFYQYYLTEHSNRFNRNLHFVGTGIVIALFLLGIIQMDWTFFAAIPFAGYGFAWVGHFFIEKNKPATFKHPIYSFMGDCVMFTEILKGKHRII